MNGGNIKRILIALSLLMVFSSFASAVPFGATTDEGATEHGLDTISETAIIHGGNASELNISGVGITSRWGGFFGFVSGGIQLADAAANKFFEWTVTNFTNSVVYAANASVSDWDLRAMNQSNLPADVMAGQDRYNVTFIYTDTFQTNGVGPIANAPYAKTYQGGSLGVLRTYALITNDNAVNVWAGIALQNSTSFRTGERVDYQIIAPARTSGTQYNFYLELP
jgi:hypothetical protein